MVTPGLKGSKLAGQIITLVGFFSGRVTHMVFLSDINHRRFIYNFA